MNINYHTIKERIGSSKFATDSFWAVTGNGLGYGLLLLSGIFIARILGKSLYGEYGLVKSTMFQLALFSTIGLAYTSTKFVAESLNSDKTATGSIIRASLFITTVSSLVFSFILILFAHPLAVFLKEPSLALAFRTLGVIVVFKAITATGFGLLGGFGNYKKIALANVSSGIVMLVASIPMTYFFSIKGALLALTISQIIPVLINARSLMICKRGLPRQRKEGMVAKIIKFSIPVGMQEFTFALGMWLGLFVIARYSNTGEVGLYTAGTMWNSVILFLPGLLENVMLSHLCSDKNKSAYNRNLNMMLGINFICTIIPFIIIFLLSPWIVTFYGKNFDGLLPVMRVLVFTTVFTCCSNVLSSDLIAKGKTWALFFIRLVRDMLTPLIGFLLITNQSGANAALNYSYSCLGCSALFFMLLYVYCLSLRRASDKQHSC